MNSPEREIELSASDSKVLVRAGIAALMVEFVMLTAFGWYNHWLAHPQKTTGLDSSKFIEAEVFQPRQSHLTEEKIAAPKVPEAVLSKVPDQGKKPENKAKLDEENQTQAGPPLTPTHGPVATVTPLPTIPEFLRTADLNVSAVIDFFVSAQGGVTPRLVGSTGNEELDAIAIGTAKRWQFRPAEQNHKPIDSKVRLRILFQVR